MKLPKSVIKDFCFVFRDVRQHKGEQDAPDVSLERICVQTSTVKSGLY